MTAPRAARPVLWLAMPAGRPAFVLVAATRAAAEADAAAVAGQDSRVAELIYAWGYLTRPVLAGAPAPRPRPGTRLDGTACLWHVAGGPREFRILAGDTLTAGSRARAILGARRGSLTVTSQGSCPALLAEIAGVLTRPEPIGARA